jgi:hypothetical protein
VTPELFLLAGPWVRNSTCATILRIVNASNLLLYCCAPCSEWEVLAMLGKWSDRVG